MKVHLHAVLDVAEGDWGRDYSLAPDAVAADVLGYLPDAALHALDEQFDNLAVIVDSVSVMTVETVR